MVHVVRPGFDYDAPLRGRLSIMPETITTTELLENLKSPSHRTAWELLDSRMRPVILAVVQRLGLAIEEAEEVAQAALVEVFEGYQNGKYQRGRGRLRSWVVGIARNLALDSMGRRARAGGGLSGAEVPDAARVSVIWDEEWNRFIAREAMARLRTEDKIDPRTVRAFELFALSGVPAEQAAVECKMTVGQVYVSKNRVAGRLQEIVGELTAAYEDGP
jgi:DNA-directed RNA polymerase specialized sigma24 family protein